MLRTGESRLNIFSRLETFQNKKLKNKRQGLPHNAKLIFILLKTVFNKRWQNKCSNKLCLVLSIKKLQLINFIKCFLFSKRVHSKLLHMYLQINVKFYITEICIWILHLNMYMKTAHWIFHSWELTHFIRKKKGSEVKATSRV